jgi:hypothetical protein
VRSLGKASLVTALLRVDECRGGVGELARPSRHFKIWPVTDIGGAVCPDVAGYSTAFLVAKL